MCCAEPGRSGAGSQAHKAVGHALAEPQPARESQTATAAQAVLASPGENVALPTAHRALQGTPRASAALDIAQSGCAERFAAPAQHHADPFGILEYTDMWPANSTARVKPRPYPVGPAYNSSHFDVFINTSFVMLVRSPGCGRSACYELSQRLPALRRPCKWRRVFHACPPGHVALCSEECSACALRERLHTFTPQPS